MTDVAVTDVTVAKEQLVRQRRMPVNDNPSRVLVEWFGRIQVALGALTYGRAVGIPLATVSSDVVSAGVLYSIGVRRLSNVISVALDNGLMIGNATAVVEPTGTNQALAIAYDRELGTIRVFNADVDSAGTPDNLQEAAEDFVLGSATVGCGQAGGSAAVVGFFDCRIVFWTSDLTIGAG